MAAAVSAASNTFRVESKHVVRRDGPAVCPARGRRGKYPVALPEPGVGIR